MQHHLSCLNSISAPAATGRLPVSVSSHPRLFIDNLSVCVSSANRWGQILFTSAWQRRRPGRRPGPPSEQTHTVYFLSVCSFLKVSTPRWKPGKWLRSPPHAAAEMVQVARATAASLLTSIRPVPFVNGNEEEEEEEEGGINH